MLTKLVHLDLDPSTVSSLLQIIFWTHSAYEDRPSRRAVQSCLVSIISSGLDLDLLAPFIAALTKECQKPGIAPTVAFVLVEWCSLLTQHLAQTPQWERFGPQIIQSHAFALEKCLGPTAKPGISHSAVVITRRGLRKLFSQESPRGEKAVEATLSLLAAKGNQPTARNAPYLGVIAGVSSRIPAAKPVLEKHKDQYFAFYSREIVSSRASVPKHIAGAFLDFFVDFASLAEIEKEVLPAVEKGLLRAPEVVLCDVLVPLVDSLPKSFDLSEILAKSLLKPILSNVKSSNAAVRSGVASSFAALCLRTQSSPSLDKALDEILVPLKSGKLTSVDQRLLHAQLLEHAPFSDDKVGQVASALATVAAKEGNEGCLQAETSTLAHCCVRLGLNIPKDILDSFVKGLADKKVPSRRIWILRTGQVLGAAMEDDTLAKAAPQFIEATLPKLLDSYNEVLNNPLAASQNGLVVAGYIVTAVTPWLEGRLENAAVKAALAKVSIPKQALFVEPKPSFLLNPRIYSKLTADDEFRWLSRALLLLPNTLLKGMAPGAALAWAEAVIFLVCSSTVHPTVSKEARDKLTRVYFADPVAISSLVINGLWHWLKSVEVADKESAAVITKSEEDALHSIVKSICLGPEAAKAQGHEPDAEQLDRQLCSFVVLGRPELVGGAGWIDLCLKAERDPGDIARKHEDVLINQIMEATSVEQKVQSCYFLLWTWYTCELGRGLTHPFSQPTQKKPRIRPPPSFVSSPLPQ